MVILLNILIALYNSAYEDITDNSIDEYMALFAQKTMQYVRAPDENVFIAPLNLIEIFGLILPFEWWMPKKMYGRLNDIVMGVIYSPLLLVAALVEKRTAEKVTDNRRRHEEDDDTVSSHSYCAGVSGLTYLHRLKNGNKWPSLLTLRARVGPRRLTRPKVMWKMMLLLSKSGHSEVKSRSSKRCCNSFFRRVKPRTAPEVGDSHILRIHASVFYATTMILEEDKGWPGHGGVGRGVLEQLEASSDYDLMI